uniref:CSON002660 protein n=1 Tax=Culicoides sonorensis TaxID=179676 RepID=A0A336LWY9_CULSO
MNSFQIIFLIFMNKIVSGHVPSVLDCANPESYQDTGKFFPDDSNCNSYFQCSHGKLVRNFCPHMNDSMGNQIFILHWDRINNVCVWPEQVCDCRSSSFYDPQCYSKKGGVDMEIPSSTTEKTNLSASAVDITKKFGKRRKSSTTTTTEEAITEYDEEIDEDEEEDESTQTPNPMRLVPYKKFEIVSDVWENVKSKQEKSKNIPKLLKGSRFLPYDYDK